MNERFPYEGTRVTFDPSEVAETGEFDLTSFLPGPAGTASVEIGGVTVSVDYAEPQRLCSLEAPRRSVERLSPVILELIGEQGVTELTRATEADDRDLVSVQLGDRLGRRRQISSRTGPDDEAARWFGGLVASLSVGDDDEDDLVRATALVEGVAQLGRTWMRIASDQVDEWMRWSVEVLAADVRGDQRLVELDPEEYEQLVAAMRSIVQTLGPGGGKRDWVRSLIDAVPRRVFDLDAERERRRPNEDERGVFAAMEPLQNRMYSAAKAAARRDLDLARFTLAPAEPEPESPRLRFTSPGRLRVDFSRKPDGGWVRVLDDALVLVAIVPVSNEGRTWFAEAVVPSDSTIDRLQVEVDDDVLPAASTLDLIREAVEFGREATQLDTRRDRSAAAQQWRTCAELWRKAGDETRANLAEAYATGRERVRREPQVHDSVRRLVD